MPKLDDYVKTADWKSEKHVPVIDCPENVKPGESFEVKATVGKAVAHPNTTEHHIAWIALHFVPESAGASYEVTRCEFSAHGQSVAGANQGPVYTVSAITAALQINEPGVLYATSYCNIHGLWESSCEVKFA